MVTTGTYSYLSTNAPHRGDTKHIPSRIDSADTGRSQPTNRQDYVRYIDEPLGTRDGYKAMRRQQSSEILKRSRGK
jgi:hypothetical protein